MKLQFGNGLSDMAWYGVVLLWSGVMRCGEVTCPEGYDMMWRCELVVLRCGEIM